MSVVQSTVPVIGRPSNDQLGEKSARVLVPGEDVGRRKMRALLGWFDESEAVAAQLGRMPGTADDCSELRARAAHYRARVSSRGLLQLEDPRVPAGDQALLHGIENRVDVRSTFTGLNWTPSFVDLRRVLSFQKFINQPDEAVPPPPADDADALCEFCLPTEQPLPPVGAIGDTDGKGFTIGSLNPNLRIAGAQVNEGLLARGEGLPPMKVQAVTFFVCMGASYLQVVRYRDRCFIRDGYHRATKLLRANISVVPCVFIEATSFAQVCAPAGSFSYEVLYGTRPPLLTDFWNDDVAADVEQLAIRKVVRVRGDEFVVAR